MSDDALILRTVEETEPLDNKRGVTYRVQVVGGGGGSVDYSKTVQKTTTMPAADSSNAGDVYMYTGATDANYTTNYIYENITTTTSSSASATQTVGSGLSDISVDIDTLESFTGWTTDNSLQIFYTADGWSVDTTSLGVTYTGAPSVGDAITITYTAEVNTYAWTRVDVQPAGSSLPNQTGQSGKFLTTDGTDASWSDKPLVNNTTSSKSLAIGNSATATTGNSVVVGVGSYVNGGFGSTVIVGYNSSATSEATAIGQHTQASQTGCIAIGNNAASIATRAIQIGSGSNSESGTLCVGLYHNGQFPNYKLLDSDGTIPTARFTTDPSADGTYYPTLTISSGTPTRSWSTIAALQNTATGTGSLTILSSYPTSTASSVNIGAITQATGPNAITVGYNSVAGRSGVAIGSGAQCTGGYAVAIGSQAVANGGSTSNTRIAIGYAAIASANFAIQLGSAIGGSTNSDANTFKVANGNGNFEIMDANGNLPADRLASTTGLADGNYRLRLTMASGVPTLSWVAE